MTRLQVQATAGRPTALSLDPVPAVGYAWDLEPVDGVRLVEHRADEESLAPGAAAPVDLSLLADEPGDYVVVLRLSRSWEREQPLQVVTVDLTVADPA